MTSEKRLRGIVAREATLRLPAFDILCDKYPDLTGADWDRVYDLLHTYPILDLPVSDEKGRFFPEHDINYEYVRRCVTDDRYIRFDLGLGFIILTRAEALELAGILTAAAMEEA